MPQNSLNVLMNEYKIPLEVAFEIFRPSVKHISEMKADEWKQFHESVGSVIKTFILCPDKYINRCKDNDKLKAYLNENYQKMESVMSSEFFTAFWMLTLDSICFPAKLYSEKIEEVKVTNWFTIEKSINQAQQRH